MSMCMVTKVMALSMGKMLVTFCFFAALPSLALQDCDCFRIPNRSLGKAIDPGVEANEALFIFVLEFATPSTRGVNNLHVQCFNIPLNAEQNFHEQTGITIQGLRVSK